MDRGPPSIALTSRVPFVDLGGSHARLRSDILEDIAALLDSSTFTNGPSVAEFENAFAAYCGTTQCVGVASGLDALRLGLLAAGIEPGDEVVVPALTFAATFEAVVQAGGMPVVVDVSDRDYNLDVEQVEASITPSTRFLLPVHLYGQMADCQALRRLAERHLLGLLEDACQAHGAERDGLRAGCAGIAAAFSFYPSKNLGAIGDAGALVTHDVALAARARALREHGQVAKYDHALLGYTARLDTVQALVLLRKLPLLEAWNEERRRCARFYTDALDGVGDVRTPPVQPGSKPVWYVYAIRTRERARLERFLAERGVETARHYPAASHRTAAFASLGHPPGSFPIAEALAEEELSLPLFPGISQGQLELIVSAIRDFFRRG
jgi:dTDP-3-amino-3,4,6-trideoxy-alpha-D-glucose transaminase